MLLCWACWEQASTLVSRHRTHRIAAMTSSILTKHSSRHERATFLFRDHYLIEAKSYFSSFVTNFRKWSFAIAQSAFFATIYLFTFSKDIWYLNYSIVNLKFKRMVLVYIGLATILVTFCVYEKKRRRSVRQVRSNCWCCGRAHSIKAYESNNWICKGCDQFNGFTPEGKEDF